MEHKKRKIAVWHLFYKTLPEQTKVDGNYIRELLEIGVICTPYSDFEVVYQHVKD